MSEILRKLKYSCKYPFYKIRNVIKYFRVTNELEKLILEIRKENPNIRLFLTTDNLGEVYVFCCFLKYLKSLDKDLVILTLKEQKYIMQLTNIFPYIARTCFVSHRASSFIKKEKLFINDARIQSFDIYGCDFQDTKPTNMVEAFKLSLNIDRDLPSNAIVHTASDINKIQLMFSNKLCKFKKTIFLTPEARSFEYSMLSKEFWIELAECLVKNGYDVIFNSKQQYNNYPSVFLSIGDTILFAKLCGYVIGVRSGLLDVLAGETDVLIQAIYPNDDDIIPSICEQLARFSFPKDTTAAEKLQLFYSLKNIRDDEKIDEIILKSQTKEALIQDILYNLNK